MKPSWLNAPTNAALLPALAFVLIGLCALPVPGAAQELSGIQPLLCMTLDEVSRSLPAGTTVLFEPAAIEHFLAALDGAPPDWAAVYGHGHHDPGHDERLYNLNRERDAARTGKEALSRRIAVRWSGELSNEEPQAGGFRVALGPVFMHTRWGMVRFKYEDLPANLIALPSMELRPRIQDAIAQGRPVEVHVIMSGTLVPDESVVYDFSHDEDGLGLIMPVVRVDRLYFVLASA